MEGRKIFIFFAGLTAFLLMLGFIGRGEWADEVILSMPESVYKEISDSLSTDDGYRIAEEYYNNADKYRK